MGWALGAFHASDGQVQCWVVVGRTAEPTSKMEVYGTLMMLGNFCSRDLLLDYWLIVHLVGKGIVRHARSRRTSL